MATSAATLYLSTTAGWRDAMARWGGSAIARGSIGGTGAPARDGGAPNQNSNKPYARSRGGTHVRQGELGVVLHVAAVVRHRERVRSVSRATVRERPRGVRTGAGTARGVRDAGAANRRACREKKSRLESALGPGAFRFFFHPRPRNDELKPARFRVSADRRSIRALVEPPDANADDLMLHRRVALSNTKPPAVSHSPTGSPVDSPFVVRQSRNARRGSTGKRSSAPGAHFDARAPSAPRPRPRRRPQSPPPCRAT